jgi:hypothetical protein
MKRLSSESGGSLPGVGKPRPWGLGFTRKPAEVRGEATERPGEPGDREYLCAFRFVVRSARLFSAVRMGGVSVFQLGTPLAPGRAWTNWIGYSVSSSAIHDRRLWIDHRPVAPRSSLHGLSRDPGSIHEQTPVRTVSRPRGPAQPIPIAALGRIQAPSPCDGDSDDCAAGFNADHSEGCRIDNTLISRLFISRTPGIQHRQSPYLPPPRLRRSSPEGGRRVTVPTFRPLRGRTTTRSVVRWGPAALAN